MPATELELLRIFETLVREYVQRELEDDPTQEHPETEVGRLLQGLRTLEQWRSHNPPAKQ
jgi:hypothetical protein